MTNWRKFWRERDLWVKAFSLLVAIVIWVFVTQRTQGPTEIGWHMAVPLEVRHLGAGLTASGLPRTIDVAVQAAPAEEQSARAQVKAYVDLSGLPAGRHRLVVVVPAPAIGRVVGVNPRNVSVSLAANLERMISVQVTTVGSPADNMVALTATASPSEVKLTGPDNVVRSVDRVAVEANLAGAQADLDFIATAVPFDAGGRPVSGVEVSPSLVRVNVPVVAGTSVRLVPIKVVIDGRPAAGFVAGDPLVQPDRAQVVSGAGQAVPTEISTQPVNIEGASADVTGRVALVAPDGSRQYRPAAVQVTVPITPQR